MKTAKKWKKPELTILVRMAPEETVLAICKTDNFGDAGTGFNSTHNAKC